MPESTTADDSRRAGLTHLLDGQLEAAAATVRALPSSKGERRFDLPPELERMLDQLGYAVRDER